MIVDDSSMRGGVPDLFSADTSRGHRLRAELTARGATAEGGRGIRQTPRSASALPAGHSQPEEIGSSVSHGPGVGRLSA